MRTRERGASATTERRTDPNDQPRQPRVEHRRPAARRVQAGAVRVGGAAHDRPAAHGVRDRPAQGADPRPRGPDAQRAAAGAVGAAGVRAQHLQHRPLHAEDPAPRARGAARQPGGVPARLLPQRRRHLRPLRVREADRQAGREGPALPGGPTVLRGGPAPLTGHHHRHGLDLRGPHPPLRRGLQRDRRGALHPARRRPPHGRPAHRPRRRRPVPAGRGAQRLRPHGRHRRDALGARGARPGAEPAGADRDGRTGAQRRVLRHLQVGHDWQGPGRGRHRPGRHPGERPARREDLRLLPVQPALRRRLEGLPEESGRGAQDPGLPWPLRRRSAASC